MTAPTQPRTRPRPHGPGPAVRPSRPSRSRPPRRDRRAPSRTTTRRRILAFLVTVCLAFGALVTRLAMVQVGGHARYTAFGEQQLVQHVRLPAARGAIFDRDGRELAMSVRQTTIWANPKQVTDPAGEAAQLAPVVGVDAGALQDRLSLDGAFVYVARMVPDDIAAKVKALDLPGIHYSEEPKRFTPAGDLALPVIGRVGTDNTGLGGIEQQFDKLLAGKPGEKVVEQDPTGTPLPDGVRKNVPAVRGDDLVLTLDRSLQFETERALSAEIVAAKAKGGIALVMDTSTGEILAMANLSAGEKSTDPPRPADSNLALTQAYEPGSVNKLITISGALEEGVIRADDKLLVPPSIKVADTTFSEHDYHPPQQWSITDIMANSSNVGAITIGEKLGKDRLDKYLRAYGFGSKTGLGFPGETRGIMIDTKDWSGTSIGTIPIGQGIAVTAVQMLAAYNTVANGGVYVAPKLVKATIDEHGEQHPTAPSATHRVVSAKTAHDVTSMLDEVVRVGTGTAAAIDGYTVAGKTGTARKPLVGQRGYKVGAYVSSFAGFVPAERPALTAVVMLDEPTPIYGGLVAAPVFASMMRYGLRQLRIPPPPLSSSNDQLSVTSPDAALTGSGEPDAAKTPLPTVPANASTTTTAPVSTGAGGRGDTGPPTTLAPGAKPPGTTH
ncbi:MAG TPA: penicillin-binding protein 2 [Acidimicrobiales bacterium]|nr:penicillin-binding protein 2 [Acidimicrobiales bacterium]